MKRHITELEQKLIDSGWKLLYKTYKGKNSQFVWCYVYGKAYGDKCFKLALDQNERQQKAFTLKMFQLITLILPNSKKSMNYF